MTQTSLYVSSINVRLLLEKNAMRLTKIGMPLTRNVQLLVERLLQTPAMIDPKSMVEQKTSITTARPKAMTLHGVPAIVITSDTPTIVSPLAC